MLSLGFDLISIEKLLDCYDFSDIKEIVKQVEKNKDKEKGIFKNYLLEIIEGMRLAYYSVMSKNGLQPYKRFYKQAQKEIRSLVGKKEITVWDNLKQSKRI